MFKIIGKEYRSIATVHEVLSVRSEGVRTEFLIANGDAFLWVYAGNYKLWKKE